VDTLQVEAVYENGTLKLPHELPLKEGQRVTVTIKAKTAVQHLTGILPWKGDPKELERWLNDPDEGMWGPRDD
jgi:predicted DNA-binding antitoxin AbrB/MazE fold protein